MKADNAIEWHSQIADDFDLKYEHKKPFIERYDIFTRAIAKYSNHNNLVLDIGCGSGTFSFYSAKYNGRVIGIDASINMIKICEQKKLQTNNKNVTFITQDINTLNQTIDKQVDVNICSSVIEYLDDLDKSLELIIIFT